MIELRGSLFTQTMPDNLASQAETQAFAYALGRQIDKLLGYADAARVYAAIDTAPETLLDYLAVELRTPSYSETYSLEVKRVLVKNSLIDYCRSIMGNQGCVVSSERVTEDGDTISLLETLPDPQTIADAAEARELLHTLTDAKHRYRGIARKGVQAIEMQIYGYSTREIAAMYGVRTYVVSAWVSRARKLLIREVEMPAYANRA